MMVAFREACKLPKGLGLGLLVGLLGLLAIPSAQAQSPWDADAELHDVFVLDGRTGWAVGDRGVVWKTTDGGQSWTQQPTPTTARLNCVRFEDSNNGWIAGEEWEAHTGLSRGVLLATTDGGETWKPAERMVLPGLMRVGLFDRTRGWALARPNAVFPSGAFTTVDGGLNWTPLDGAEIHGWLCGDYARPGAGAVGGQWGRIHAIQGHKLVPARTPAIGMRSVRDIHFAKGGSGWAVGDGGLVLRSTDGGQSWSAPAGRLPSGTDTLFDFRTVSAHGSKVWIAGEPGGRVLVSDNDGQSWQWLATGQTLPINRLRFLDQRIGWAVGPLGTILVTVDGGLSWKLQQSGGTQAAILSLLAQPNDTPYEVLARHAGNEGFLAVTRWLVRDPPLAASPHQFDLAAQSVGVVGVSAAEQSWRFPLPPAGMDEGAKRVVAFWDELHEGKAVETLERELVRSIRMWRPSVVITPAAHRQTLGPLDYLLNQITTRALEAAGDASKYPDQISVAGLQPWQVRKIYGSLGPLAEQSDDEKSPAAIASLPTGDLVIDATQLAIRLGGSVGEASAKARGFLPEWNREPPTGWSLQLLRSRPAGISNGDLTTGLVLEPGQGARRPQSDAVPGGAVALRQLTDGRRNVAALLQYFERVPSGPLKLNSQLNTLIATLDGETAASAILQAAEIFQREGNWSRAAETHHLVLERFPAQAAAAKSNAWLVRYLASEEAALRQQRIKNEAAGLALPADTLAPPPTGEVQTQLAAERSNWAAEYFKRLSATRPALTEAPSLRFPLAVVDERRGMTGPSHEFFLRFASQAADPVWRDCARVESWIRDKQGNPPRKTAACVMTLEPPHLDGYFDDDLWRAAEPLALPAGPHNAPAACLFAYDRQFLYLAISCRKVDGYSYTTSQEARPRDPDLSASDRLVLTLDTDRDWGVCYEFTLDHRGWVAERLWDDATWNPKWYVATQQNEALWSIEAAIPLEELTANTPTRETAWGLGIMRVVPGLGAQGWTGTVPRERLPQAAGLLMFQ